MWEEPFWETGRANNLVDMINIPSRCSVVRTSIVVPGSWDASIPSETVMLSSGQSNQKQKERRKPGEQQLPELIKLYTSLTNVSAVIRKRARWYLSPYHLPLLAFHQGIFDHICESSCHCRC